MNDAARYLRERRAPLAVAAITLIFMILATLRSAEWIGRPFPGFWIVDVGFVPNLGNLGFAESAADLAHAQVIAIDGEPLRRGGDVYRYVAAVPAGTSVEYRLRRRGEEFSRRVASVPFAVGDYARMYLPFISAAWVLWLIGFAVGLQRPRSRVAQALARYAMLAGLTATSVVFLLHAAPWLTAVWALADYISMGALLHIALLFPVQSRWLPHGSRVLLLYLPGLGLLSWIAYGVYGETLDLRPVYVAYLSFAAVAVFALTRCVVAYVRNTDTARPRLKAMLPVLLGAGGTAVGLQVSSWMGGQRASIQHVEHLVPICVAAVAYAILKQDLSDVDRLLRRTLIQALAALVVFGAFVVSTLATRLVVGPLLSSTDIVLIGMLVVVLAWTLTPLRARVQRRIATLFFDDRRSSVEEILRAGELLPSLVELETIAARLLSVAGDATRVSRCGVIIRRNHAGPLLRFVPPLDAAVAAKLSASLEDRRTLGAHARLAAVVAETLGEEVLTLLIAVSSKQAPSGALVLVPDRDQLDAATLTALSELVRRAALALRNAEAYRGLEALTWGLDAEVARQTADVEQSNRRLVETAAALEDTHAQLLEMEKMATLGQLVAGVAHEINTPASFIVNGLTNLQLHLGHFVQALRRYQQLPLGADGAAARRDMEQRLQVEQLLRRTPALLRICNEGADRIRRITDDLRTFSRLDRLPAEPTDVVHALDEALAAARQRAHKQGTEIRCSYAESLPRVDAVGTQLRRLWSILLSNALDAVQSRGGRISVRVHPGESHGVVVQVEDDGAGIAPSVQTRIFDPFFTTKPIGEGTGLGLAIAYGIVKSHAGRIEAIAGAQGGTCMRVWLPPHGQSPVSREGVS